MLYSVPLLSAKAESMLRDCNCQRTTTLPSRGQKSLDFFFFSCVFIVLFSCVDKRREQKETGRGKEDGLNSWAFTVQMFTIPSAM